MGNAIRMQLHEDPEVIFAGYKIPHPLEWKMLVKIQTKESSNPYIGMQTALSALHEEITSIRSQFNQQCEARNPSGLQHAPSRQPSTSCGPPSRPSSRSAIAPSRRPSACRLVSSSVSSIVL